MTMSLIKKSLMAVVAAATLGTTMLALSSDAFAWGGHRHGFYRHGWYGHGLRHYGFVSGGCLRRTASGHVVNTCLQ
jgi:hypothetical protein